MKHQQKNAIYHEISLLVIPDQCAMSHRNEVLADKEGMHLVQCCSICDVQPLKSLVELLHEVLVLLGEGTAACQAGLLILSLLIVVRVHAHVLGWVDGYSCHCLTVVVGGAFLGELAV